jgi:CobQ-like glutamine amidotransferase family enzyme
MSAVTYSKQKGTKETPSLTIVHLYPKEMNIYGDTGNVLVLRRRAEWRGVAVTVKQVGVGQAVPADADIIIGGGGQDAGQGAIQQDLQAKAVDLHRLANQGAVMLMICGMYQLFGRFFKTHEGELIQGIGVLPLETVGGTERLIGNTHYEMPFGEVIGYENHSGLTKLDHEQDALGSALLGAGNNSSDKFEGCRVHNVFGTYSHGPVLAKNPNFADELLRLALQRKYGASFGLKPLDDALEQLAHDTAKMRPR